MYCSLVHSAIFTNFLNNFLVQLFFDLGAFLKIFVLDFFRLIATDWYLILLRQFKINFIM